MKAAALFDVAGHAALVTGAASGLGLAFAGTMAANGARVTMVDLDAPALQAAAAGLRAEGGAVTAVVADVSDADALRAAIDETAAREGRLDALFANVGVSAGPGFAAAESGRLEAIDPGTFDRVLGVNLKSTVMAMKFAAPHMKRRRGGSIVVTSSIAGLKSESLVGYAYVAAKAALVNVVRQAAIELAPFNVRVNAIAPGPFFTNIRGGVMFRDPKVVDAFAAMVPMGRCAQPAEIMGLALLLASPAGSFITGTVIPVDGGTTAR